MTSPNADGWEIQGFIDGYGDGRATWSTGQRTIGDVLAYLAQVLVDTEAHAILIRRGPQVETADGGTGPWRLVPVEALERSDPRYSDETLAFAVRKIGMLCEGKEEGATELAARLVLNGLARRSLLRADTVERSDLPEGQHSKGSFFTEAELINRDARVRAQALRDAYARLEELLNAYPLPIACAAGIDGEFHNWAFDQSGRLCPLSLSRRPQHHPQVPQNPRGARTRGARLWPPPQRRSPMRSNRLAGLRKRLMFWLHDGWPEWKPIWFMDATTWLACKVAGHDPIGDQCGRPEHDFCAWCRKLMPFAAPRRKAGFVVPAPQPEELQ